VSDLEDRVRTVTAQRPTELRRRRVALEVIEGPDRGARHVFDGRARMGTRSLADFVLTDAQISGLHCELSGEDLRLRDLGSKNGTFVGGLRVLDAFLSPGEVLRIGVSRLRATPLDETVPVALGADARFHGLFAYSPAMAVLTAQLQRLAASDATVLVTGETGTGKERVVEALHLARGDSARPLVVVDCGALPANLVESELFGHERGAFTGADAATAGAFERADGGTLFLDEVGELPLDVQPKLLRALEARTVARLGGGRAQRVNVHVVAATHRDLSMEVSRGRFREDLYYRLAVVTLAVPALRDRAEDIPLLAEHLLEQMGADPHQHLTAHALATLAAHDWPGNVRELRNTLERAVALTRPVEIESMAAASEEALPVDLAVTLREGRRVLVDRYERAYVSALLDRCGGNISEAARRSGMDRITLHRILQRLQLRRPRAGKS
jgi:two-component system response regulator GlrR